MDRTTAGLLQLSPVLQAEEAQGSEVQNIDVYQHLNHKEGSIGVETTGALETSPWSEYDEAGFSDVADLQSFFDPRGEDGYADSVSHVMHLY